MAGRGQHGSPQAHPRTPWAARYAVLLRAINGSPRNRLSMVDLRRRIEFCGLADVSSYLSTGNVAVTDPLGRSPSGIAAALDAGLARSGLVRADAVVWRPSELHDLVAADWFVGHPATHWRQCASFLSSMPRRDGRAAVQARGGVIVHADHRIVLTAYPRERTAFSLNVEEAYQVSATTRWWNVVAGFTREHLRGTSAQSL
ncbi:DUF1697 domain-containing protein [Blastococcus sp. SYSU DS0552]